MTGGAGNDEMHDAQLTHTPVTHSGDKRVIPNDTTVTEGQGKWRQSDVAGQWTVVTDKEYFGIATVDIIDDSTLKFNYHRTSTGEIFDSVVLQRDHSIYMKN
jgi:hypothetical protein